MTKHFEPDLFSEGTPRYQALAGEAAARMEIFVAERFGDAVGRVSVVERVCGIEVNSSNFRITGARGRYLLKRARADFYRNDPATTSRLALWLRERSVPVPLPVAAADGSWVVKGDDSAWTLWGFVDGSYFTGGADQLDAAAECVACLHEALAAVPAALRPRARIDYPLDQFVELHDEAAARKGEWDGLFGPEHAAMLRRGWRTARRTLDLLRRNRDAIEAQDPAICHFDLHPRNLLVADGRVAAILDLAAIGLTLVPAAVGFSAYKLVRQHAVAKGLAARTGAIREEAARFAKTACAAPAHAACCGVDLGLFARLEVFRRLSLILELMLRKGDDSWNRVLGIQLAALEEIDTVFGAE